MNSDASDASDTPGTPDTAVDSFHGSSPIADLRAHLRPDPRPGTDSTETTPTAQPHTTVRAGEGPVHGTTLLKLDEVARELRCTRRTLERQIAARLLPVIHIGRAVRVERTALERYLTHLRDQEPNPTAAGEHGPTP